MNLQAVLNLSFSEFSWKVDVNCFFAIIKSYVKVNFKEWNNNNTSEIYLYTLRFVLYINDLKNASHFLDEAKNHATCNLPRFSKWRRILQRLSDLSINNKWLKNLKLSSWELFEMKTLLGQTESPEPGPTGAEHLPFRLFLFWNISHFFMETIIFRAEISKSYLNVHFPLHYAFSMKVS